MKAYGGSRVVAPFILNLGSSWRWLVSFMPTVAFESEAWRPPQLVWSFRRRWCVFGHVDNRTSARPTWTLYRVIRHAELLESKLENVEVSQCANAKAVASHVGMFRDMNHAWDICQWDTGHVERVPTGARSCVPVIWIKLLRYKIRVL
jgi:hypothetical protein